MRQTAEEAIKADTYDNVARLREVQKIEKILKKQKQLGHKKAQKAHKILTF